MMSEIEAAICERLNAGSCELQEEIQSLWSGYGMIRRALVDGQSVIVKHIDISNVRQNQRGWGNDFAHRRKVASYQIEQAFYFSFGSRCGDDCRVANILGSQFEENAAFWLIVLEDLDQVGFTERRSDLTDTQLLACLKWLANFHGTFLNVEPAGLWPIGTYWHLATRPDELNAMPEGPLKQFASSIDEKLNSAKFKTLVHGDAKVANFCFSAAEEESVAAVDFQYVGGGCGMKDVAYFISSCLHEDEAQNREGELLDAYFQQLRLFLSENGSSVQLDELESEWRDLYPFAWADFYRFLAGWSPGHWKMNNYSKQLTSVVISRLDSD